MTTPSQSMGETNRLLEIAKQQGDFVTGDDGFVIYWPTSSGSRGALTSWMLRALADEIDRLNEPAEAALEAYFNRRAALNEEEG
jgi:hypothetical protein